jgi:hypothetical protein
MNRVILKNVELPKKFSYHNKPITLEADVKMIGERLTEKIKKKIIHRSTELAGIMPFDWFLCDDCKQHFVMMFGFDTMESARAARARLENSKLNVRCWIEDEEKRAEARQLGKAIESYIHFRAKQEGLKYELTSDFFEQRILAGVGKFFGITVANGRLLGDDEQPGLFKQWNELN